MDKGIRLNLSAKQYVQQHLSPMRLEAFINNFERLTNRQRDCLIRYTIHLETLEVIGEAVGLTGERVRQVIQKAQRIVGGEMEAAATRLKMIDEREGHIRILTYKIETMCKQLEERRIKVAPIADAYATTLEDACLSVRLYSGLKAGGCNCIGDIMQISFDNFFAIRNMGKRSFLELQETLLVDHGLVWPIEKPTPRSNRWCLCSPA